MKLFKNKFFIICLCVAIVLAAVPSTLSVMGYKSLSRNIVGTLTAPFRWCATAISDTFEGFGRYFTSLDALHARNEALEEENRQLREENSRAELIEQENERLRDYLQMKNRYPSFSFEEAMIISYSAGNYATGFTLNRGTLHGIEINMPVVTTQGIVGYVVDVGLNWCMVSTLIETASSVGAYVPRTGATGIVSGDYSMRQEGCCKLSYIEGEANIAVGDTVLSSGMGSVYPSELPIGEIISIEVDEYTRMTVATVRPFVDYSELKWVMVITGYEGSTQ